MKMITILIMLITMFNVKTVIAQVYIREFDRSYYPKQITTMLPKKVITKPHIVDTKVTPTVIKRKDIKVVKNNVMQPMNVTKQKINQVKKHKKKDIKKRYYRHLFRFRMHEGSLKDNVEHMIKKSHWGKVIWQPHYDYDWQGKETIVALNVQNALEKLLIDYPLQAVFYDVNHVIVITPKELA